MTFLDLYKDVVDEKINAAVTETKRQAEQQAEQRVKQCAIDDKIFDIRSIMQNLKLSLEQAMDALNVPEDKREIYASMIEG